MTELSPGTSLSHYRIISRIGAGGMGEVYRAQDTELGRQVALKFLSGEVSSHDRALKRFIQEAQAASALNHPNILTIYEIGREGDQTFIATEFVDGQTLRQLIRQRLRLSEALDIAIQVASALAAAHAAGIVHRDIKPENIMVRSDGIVKLLDFGLAKLSERPDLLAGSEESTFAMVQTEPGSILGTVAYMSPEQAAGREVDARADIWSLGVVLYEMVASYTPFQGASKSHIIVAILDHQPLPITQFTNDVPQPLEWIIGEALTKDREERCQTAKEMLGKLKRLKQQIESGPVSLSLSDNNRSLPPLSVQGSRSGTGATALSSARTTFPETQQSTLPSSDQVSITGESGVRSHKKAIAAAVLLLLILVGVVGYALYSQLSQPKQFGPAKMTALTTGGKINGEDINGQVSISPDGKYVVGAANDNKQQTSLWIRQVSTNSVVRLVGPEGAAYLATTFSPDGEFIYYVSISDKNKFVPTLYRIPVLGGTPTRVLERVFSAVAFNKDGNQFAFVRKNENDMTLMVANTDGSAEPRVVASRKQSEGFSTSGPAWSPDGQRIACGVINDSGGHSTVVEFKVEGGEPRSIGSERWANVGRVIWLADGSGLVMTAQPELSSIGTQIWFLPYPGGKARRITNDLNGYGDVSLGLTSDSRTIATIQQVSNSSIWITALNEPESNARQIVKTGLPETVAWAPDGRVVYASRTGENWDIWITNQDGSSSRQLMSDAFIDQQPSISQDGRYVLFQSNRAGTRNIWRVDLDGTNAKQLTTGTSLDAYPVSTPDGLFVIYMSMGSRGWTIWKVGIDGGAPTQVTERPAELPTISPDGKLIACFYKDEQANNQPRLMVVPVEGGAPAKTIELPPTVQAIAFAWMPDGKSIAYADNSSGIFNVWSKPIDGGAPKQLTNFKSELLYSFAISRDGKIAVYRLSVTRDIVQIKDFR